MNPDHFILTIICVALLAIFADHCSKNGKPATSQKSAADGKFASDEDLQMKQVLELSAGLRDLEGRFTVLAGRLPEETRSEAIKREFVILAEQLRICRSYENELLRHVFSWRGRSSDSFSSDYRPTYSQATWAYTAANLTRSFAEARLLALGA